MKIIECEQGSPEWFAARTGIPTASEFDKIIELTGKISKQRQKYMYRLAGERVAGIREEGYQSPAMIRGTIMEEEARNFYEITTGNKVQQVGFCTTGLFGCSPDGFVGDDGTIEIKCPLIATHVSYLVDEKLPSDYFQQVQGGLFVTGRKWCDFISYFPGLKPLVVRVVSDETFHASLGSELNLFCDQLDDLVKQIDR